MAGDTDTVTSSATATGDVAGLRAREEALGVLFAKDRASGGPDDDLARALEEAADTPAIGAVAAVELARITSGWSVAMGKDNGLKKYQAFADALVKGGWFERVDAMTAAPPPLDMGQPVASVEGLVAAAYPGLDGGARREVARALIRSLSHALGPDGIPAEEVTLAEGALGKPEVLERRVTTVASNLLHAGDAPQFDMRWRTEIFTRTKDGKDDPKTHTDRDIRNHTLRFDVARWQSGDRSVLLEYFRRVDDWLDDFNTTKGRPRTLSCFDPLMG